ncbi:MAG: MarR family transcriptional regulator [Myxococcales bacterium]|nr:MarR family transcriptional regulator [Myxococcales bacterium]
MESARDATLDLDQQLCFALYSASRRVVRAYTLVLKQFELTYPQYLVLLVLWEWHRDGCERPTVTALGDRLELDSGTLTPLIRRLIALGLVEKQRQREDERTVFVNLTPAGVRMKRKVKSVPLAMLEQCSLPVQEVEQLRKQLDRLR